MTSRDEAIWMPERRKCSTRFSRLGQILGFGPKDAVLGLVLVRMTRKPHRPEGAGFAPHAVGRWGDHVPCVAVSAAAACSHRCEWGHGTPRKTTENRERNCLC